MARLPFARQRRERAAVIGSNGDDAFYVGRCWDEASGFVAPVIGPKMQMPGTEPIVVIGRNRSGKDAGIGNYNALRLQGRSWWSYSPRGEDAAISGAYRATLGPTYMINPAGMHADLPGYEDLRSHGRNPLSAVDWNSDFFDDVARIVAAWLRLPAHGDIHWMLSARGLVQSLCMFEVQRAAIEGRPPSVWNVRALLTEADKFDPKTQRPLKGLAATALRIIAEGGPQAASLIGRFVVARRKTTSSGMSTVGSVRG